MASALKNLSEHDPSQVPSAAGMRIGIVVSEYNEKITFALRDGCIETLKKYGVAEEDLRIWYVPGAYELPFGAKKMHDHSISKSTPWNNEQLHAVISIGCVITGETKHDDYINQAVAQGIMQLNMERNIPFVFGLLTPRNMEQALDRAGGKHGNKGVEVALAAIKMIALAK